MSSKRKLTDKEVQYIYKAYCTNATAHNLAIGFDVSVTTIYNIIYNKTYKNVDKIK